MNLARRVGLPTAALFASLWAMSWSEAQIIKDPPWNPDHINNLPADVRGAVLAMCGKPPNAGHYFATYSGDRINLHFEHFHCGQAANSFCNNSGCLHQVYQLSAGHYRLARSFYGSRSD